jgi:hypothetical protein
VKILLLIALVLPASAFDEADFGRQLNGWHYDGSARYSLDGARYRTKKPLTVLNADGSRTVTVTVIHVAKGWADVPSNLEVAFAPDGKAQSFRITGNPHGHKVNTGLITRPEPPAPAAGQATVAFDSLSEMKKALFAAYEAQASAAAEGKELRKRDLLNRIAGGEQVDVAALSAGLRYNLDLILGQQRAAGK